MSKTWGMIFPLIVCLSACTTLPIGPKGKEWCGESGGGCPTGRGGNDGGGVGLAAGVAAVGGEVFLGFWRIPRCGGRQGLSTRPDGGSGVKRRASLLGRAQTKTSRACYALCITS